MIANGLPILFGWIALAHVWAINRWFYEIRDTLRLAIAGVFLVVAEILLANGSHYGAAWYATASLTVAARPLAGFLARVLVPADSRRRWTVAKRLNRGRFCWRVLVGWAGKEPGETLQFANDAAYVCRMLSQMGKGSNCKCGKYTAVEKEKSREP